MDVFAEELAVALQCEDVFVGVDSLCVQRIPGYEVVADLVRRVTERFLLAMASGKCEVQLEPQSYVRGRCGVCARVYIFLCVTGGVGSGQREGD